MDVAPDIAPRVIQQGISENLALLIQINDTLTKQNKRLKAYVSELEEALAEVEENHYHASIFIDSILDLGMRIDYSSPEELKERCEAWLRGDRDDQGFQQLTFSGGIR